MEDFPALCKTIRYSSFLYFQNPFSEFFVRVTMGTLCSAGIRRQNSTDRKGKSGNLESSFLVSKITWKWIQVRSYNSLEELCLSLKHWTLVLRPDLRSQYILNQCFPNFFFLHISKDLMIQNLIPWSV